MDVVEDVSHQLSALATMHSYHEKLILWNRKLK